MTRGRKIKGIFWRDGTWWIRWACTLGHDHRRPSGESKTAATEEHKAKRAEVREARKSGRECCPRLIRRDRPLLFEEILKDYMTYSERQKRAYRDDRAKEKCFRTLFGTRLAIDITAREVEDFLATLRADHAVATVNRYAKFLKAVFNRAIKHGRLDRNPLTPIKLERENNARNRCLSSDEEKRLLDVAPSWMRPMIKVALHTGMRLGELRALRWQDVDDKTGSVHIKRDKAGDGRWVVMNSVVGDALREVRHERKILGPFVFSSAEGKYLHNFERYWRPVITAAKIPDFRFHDLRHTFASRLAMSPGVDLYTIQRAGGWKTPTMVQRYAHLSPDHMRAAVEKLAKASSGVPTGTKTGTATK